MVDSRKTVVRQENMFEDHEGRVEKGVQES